jgi:hypothetical protein
MVLVVLRTDAATTMDATPAIGGGFSVAVVVNPIIFKTQQYESAWKECQ